MSDISQINQVPINGNYPAQHSYPDHFNPGHAAMNTAANFQPAQSSTPTTATPTDPKNNIPKDEVGWFFVEQYYTTLSRNPDKVHLFYSRRSQFVFGTEAESVPVAVGTKAINERIKQIGWQDCKVRVLNVDSQESFDNILVTVIGEISNQGKPSCKFTQTFVLAEQPNGYYVLNDIFRYLADEEELVNEEEEATPAVEAPKPEEPSLAVEAQVTDEAAASKIDEKLEQEANGEAEQALEVPAETNGAPAAATAAEEQAPVPAVEAELTKNEAPLTPEPTPVPEKQKEVAEKEHAPAPAGPKSWASMLASKVGNAPAIPAIPAAPKGAPQSAATAAAPAARAPTTEARPQEAAPTDGSGWQTAGAEHKKTQSRADEPPTHGYIKNVTDKVDYHALKQTLARFGKLNYFDISRQKNCAFVEYAEPAGYATAVAANPHQVGSEQLTVEERRPRGNAYSGNVGRGGAGRGRGDRASQGRGGFQRDGRGGFAPRGRGGNVAKSRGQAQAA
ncbi:hypothetical protein N7532_006290 [Penicillium argentinense]|uniref:NTF2 domain-containing protein n=1 Tax=Penicillium argentinense TaxID=1131581 RepID=A0A9W9FFR6_9EURO|nr:uncharacterized protein N7532_006290 [Penicillium argentinense]KAJ5099289.1 hypothetical protein N7532_006290 [Penicillium argentinense]